MNPIGDVKGFIIDVIKNIAIVFGVGYMGGSLVALSHLDKSMIDKMLPIDLNQSPYVGKKSGFSFTGYAFPYTLYTSNTQDFFSKVINWLVITCALVFSTIRSLFRSIASTTTSNSFYDILLFYVAPYLLVQVAIYARSLSMIFMIFVALYGCFIGEFVVEEEKLKNGWFYAMAPLSFAYAAYRGESEPGIMNFLIRLFMSGLACMFGCLCVFLLYPFFWYTIATSGIIYYILFLFFSPLWYGFEKVIIEMGNHRLSLTFLFMILTILSSKSFLVTLATAGVVVGSIYMFYLLIKNKFKK
jgi:hypothetical protein